MENPTIRLQFGRQAFGADPGGYHAARPAYPDLVFEIGPGTGIATRQLLDFGANPLIAVEPDGRLATYLRDTNPDRALTVIIWFDNNAEEAMDFYLPIFKDSKVIRVARNPPGAPGPEGALLVASIQLEGQEIILMNGGPGHP